MTRVPIGKPGMKEAFAWDQMGEPRFPGVGDASCMKQSRLLHGFLSLSVGPLHSELEYTVSSQKEGYILTAVEGTTGDFKAYALAGISFEVSDTVFFKKQFFWDIVDVPLHKNV